MREILFRAKQVNNGEWVEGYFAIGKWYLDEKERYAILPIDLCFYPHCEINEWIEIDPETVCQYTGMIDKNGKRIWENDIVSAWSEGKHAIGKVKRRIDGLYIIYPAYQKTEFWELCPDGNGKTEVEVIENIFDNQELLKEE